MKFIITTNNINANSTNNTNNNTLLK